MLSNSLASDSNNIQADSIMPARMFAGNCVNVNPVINRQIHCLPLRGLPESPSLASEDIMHHRHCCAEKSVLRPLPQSTAQDPDDLSSQFIAAFTRGGDEAVFQFLLTLSPFERKVLMDLGLGAMAHQGNLEGLRLLIRYGANVRTQMGADALMNAVEGGHAQTVQVLIDGGVDVKGQLGIDAIAKAAYKGQAAVLQLLIDSGAGTVDKARDRAFTNAIDQQHVEVIQVLIKDIDRMIKDEGLAGLSMGPAYFGSIVEASCNAFKRAAETGRTAILQELRDALIRFGLGLHAVGGQALDAAAYGGHTDAVRLLIDSGINAKYPGSCRALKTAAYHGYTEIVEMVLAAGVDLHHIQSAIVSAQARGHVDIVICLMEAQNQLQSLESSSSSQVTSNVVHDIDPRDEAISFARERKIEAVIECMKRIPEADRSNVFNQCHAILLQQRKPFLASELGVLHRKLDRKPEPVVVAAAPATPQPSEFWEIERACLTGITPPFPSNHPGFTYDPEKQAAFFSMKVPLVHIPPNEQSAVCKREVSPNTKAEAFAEHSRVS